MLRDQIALLTILILPSLGAMIGWLIGRKNEKYRDTLNVIVTGCTFFIVMLLYKKVMQHPIELFIPDIMGIGLYLKLDTFRYIFVWVTTFIWFLATMYSTQYLIRYKNRNRYYAFFMLTLGSTIGIFLSENILNLFTFFEIMSFTSYALIIHDEDQYAHDAGRSYIGMAIGAGMILLMGLFLLYDYTATLNISELGEKVKSLGNIKYVISGLIIVGFGAKASMVPLHVWLPKAHPAAPTPASAILSGILIKTGIFGIIITTEMMMQEDIMISMVVLVLGFMNMFLGGLLALFQRNIKRILAYSSMSQAGYILVGVGLMGILKEHRAIAVYGTLYHIFNHAIFKVLLFMGAGIIYMVLHELSINAIRGFGKNKPLLKGVFFIGLLAIIGMPGFNGFISKTLLHEALAEAHHMYHSVWFTIAEVVFTLSSGFTVAYLLKLFIAVFIESNEKYSGQYKGHIRKRAIFPMVILGLTVIYIGIRPGTVLPLIDRSLGIFGVKETMHHHFYTLGHMKSSMMSIMIGILIYIGFVRKYLRKTDGKESWFVNPSLNWFNLERDIYEPLMMFTFRWSSAVFHFIDRGVVNMVHYLGDVIKKLSGMQIKSEKYSKVKLQNMMNVKLEIQVKNPINVKGIDTKNLFEDISTEGHSLSDVLTKIGVKMNSLMYAVFIFAIILAGILVALVF
ncbi:proton-conducting transporter membrane subunit [Clostridiaceae bacterium 35-E11]